ncbi:MULTISPECIES: T9SS type A sorting domain-containing protein [unclassified Algibacter]|uniref:T9SS type A sorting domain-containing protein n=1 Tax=unclassified Algibacter TaxID=2615009 RepID=UPI001E59A299|nr:MULTISPECIES: T9SS type A sorting domain-containing protein [unclassified Algibacter]MCL5126907.1 T9SS type A sorting domain-containing protein [Algibacter sp. L4_22]
MKKQYFLIFFTIISFFAIHSMDAQNSIGFESKNDKIENLTIYPNPVSAQGNVVYIASKKNLVKNIKVFNVLGKQVLAVKLVGKALNISNLSKGVYILNITENNISETRKLVVK